MSKILDALKRLDHKNDNHWTEDGLPRVDTVKLLAGDSSITRELVTKEAPSFTRFSAAEEANAAGAQAPIVAASTTASTDTPIVAPAEQQPGAGTDQDEGGSELEQKLAAARAELAEMEAQLAAGMVIIDAKRKEVDKLIDEHSKVHGQTPLQDALAGYFAQQKANLAERGQRMQSLKATGIDFKALLTFKAPIDQAMARKTARGGQRPAHPRK